MASTARPTVLPLTKTGKMGRRFVGRRKLIILILDPFKFETAIFQVEYIGKAVGDNQLRYSRESLEKRDKFEVH